MFLSRGDRDLGVAFQTHPGRQAFISSGSKEPRSALESRRVSLGAHWVDSRESSLLRRLERGRETILKQEFRHEKEKHPLEADEADVAPDLKLVLTVESPAFERLNTKDGHQGGIQHRVPKRPGPFEERQQF